MLLLLFTRATAVSTLPENGAGEILASRETVEGIGAGFRISDPRPEVFKGFAEPVDVISVDWK